jgi:hypothetical protein
MSKRIQRLIRKSLIEAPMTYDPDYPERMSPGTERRFSSETGLYSKNPAFREGISQIEKLVSTRFKDVVDKVRGAFNVTEISQQVFLASFSRLMTEVSNVIRIESSHREELERLAIECAIEVTEVPEDWFDFNSRLNRGEIDTSDFKLKKDEIEDEEEEMMSEKKLDDEERFELEKHKRNIINAFIQGKSKKGHYIFELPSVREKLNRISPSLYNSYLKIMATNDMMYFTLDELIDNLSKTGQGVAGKVKVKTKQQSDDEDEDEEEGTEENSGSDVEIIADGLIFPILVHELIKGIEEAKGKRGLPEDPELAMRVMGQTDIMSNEPEQLLLGPPVVEKIRLAMPDEIFEDRGLINWFEDELYSYEASEFLGIIGDVLSDNPTLNKRGQKKFEEILRQAKLNRSEYESSEDDDTDELDGLLGGLGISR